MPINPTAPFPSAALNFLDSFKAVVCIWTWLPLTVQYSHSLSDFSLKNCRPWSLHVFWNLWRNLKIRSLSFFFLLENFQPEKISLKWPNNWCLFFKFPVLNKEKKLNSLINFKLWEKYILLEEDTAIWAQNSDCIYTSLQWKKKSLSAGMDVADLLWKVIQFLISFCSSRRSLSQCVQYICAFFHLSQNHHGADTVLLNIFF